MSPGKDELWQSVGHIWLRVSLGELGALEGVDEVLRAVERTLQLGCALEDLDGQPSASATTLYASQVVRTLFELHDTLGRPSGRLVFFGVVEAAVGRRLTRIVAQILDADPSLGMSRRVRHDVNNMLAVILANIELVESLLEGAAPSTPLLADATSADRADVLQAVAQLAKAARTLTKRLESTAPPPKV